MLTPEEYDEWYSWFIGMLNHKSNEAEKNAIRHLLDAQLAKVEKQEICPKCEGKKTKWIVGDVSNCTIGCPTCKGTGLKQDPDMELSSQFHCMRCGRTEKRDNEKEGITTYSDGICSQCLTEEAIRKDVREETLKEIESNFSATNYHSPEAGKGLVNSIDVDVWQSLNRRV